MHLIIGDGPASEGTEQLQELISPSGMDRSPSPLGRKAWVVPSSLPERAAECGKQYARAIHVASEFLFARSL